MACGGEVFGFGLRVHDNGFATHWLLPPAGAAPASDVCTEESRRGFDGGVDVLALEDVGREKAEDRLAGAIDDDATLEHLGDDVVGRGLRS